MHERANGVKIVCVGRFTPSAIDFARGKAIARNHLQRAEMGKRRRHWLIGVPAFRPCAMRSVTVVADIECHHAGAPSDIERLLRR